MQNRPSWSDVLAGVRPPEIADSDRDRGEWAHGWQYYASTALETREHLALMRALSGTTRRGPLPGRARLRSCRGRFAAEWMTVCPTTEALQFHNHELLFALRRRLGLGVAAAQGWCEGCGRPLDVHGHHRAACSRTARLHARHRWLIAAWRQVFQEAGGHVPRRNVE